MIGIVLYLSAGQGPRECEWVVEQLTHAFCREARIEGLVCVEIEPAVGPRASSLMRVTGPGLVKFASARSGTIRWIGVSPFRPLHKRRNWFVGVRQVLEAPDVSEFDEKDVRYQAFRSSGPGGQHVNTTDSAVRATHIPTGLTALSRDQRSQHANKRIARLKLAMLMEERRVEMAAGDKQSAWRQDHDLERGNAVRAYEGPKFRLI